MTDRRVVLVGTLLCVLALAYFYMLDRVIFSSAQFTYIFSYLLTVYDVQTAWLMVAVCMLAALWRRPAPILRVVDGVARHRRLVVSALIALSASGTVLVYHNHPFSMDEYAAVFQSRIFASGRVFAQLPPALVDWLVVPGFNGSFLIASRESGHAIEGYWPGFAMLLSPFQRLGVPWLCNALLAGLSLHLIYRLTLEITGDRRAAGWAMLFALGSGAFVANAISYYAMQAHLTANLLYALLLLRPSGLRAWAAGLVGSLALVLHNPFPHLLFAAPWITALVCDSRQRRHVLPLMLGYAPLALGVGLGWLLLRTSIAGAAQSGSVAHDIVRGVFAWPDGALVDMRVAGVVKLWVWAVPCLLLFALLGSVRQWQNPQVRLLAQSAALTFAGYLVVKLDQGHGWGYRYFHSAWGTLPVLAGCAMTGAAENRPRLVSFAGATALLSLALVVPLQLLQIEQVISHQASQLPPPVRPGNNVYFVNPRYGFYGADTVQIDPLLRSPDLMLVSRGPELDARLIQQNWPHAVRLGRCPCGEQWYLGTADRRQPVPGRTGERGFVLEAPR